MPAYLSHLTLQVDDLDAMSRFIGEIFGWKASVQEGFNCVFFQTTLSSLVLFDKASFNALFPFAKCEGPSHSLLSVNLDSRTELLRTLNHVQKAGGVVVQEVGLAPWGVYTAFFRDPEGNLWELASKK